jgi:hypothetical protein
MKARFCDECKHHMAEEAVFTDGRWTTCVLTCTLGHKMRREICGECDTPINDDGSCDCTELIKRGWRQCAVGQKTTQWCAIAESVRGELREQKQRDEALLRQALEALEVSTRFVYADLRPQCEDAIAALRERLAETANDLTRCPNCGGPADNGHDREVPPNPYWCSKCTES